MNTVRMTKQNWDSPQKAKAIMMIKQCTFARFLIEQYSTVQCNNNFYYSLALKPLAAWTGEHLLLLLLQPWEGFPQDLLKFYLTLTLANKYSPYKWISYFWSMNWTWTGRWNQISVLRITMIFGFEWWSENNQHLNTASSEPSHESLQFGSDFFLSK